MLFNHHALQFEIMNKIHHKLNKKKKRPMGHIVQLLNSLNQLTHFAHDMIKP